MRFCSGNVKVKYRLPITIVLVAVVPIMILAAVGFSLISEMSADYYRNLIYNQSMASAKHLNDFYTEQRNAISYSASIDTYQKYLMNRAEGQQISPALRAQAFRLLFLAQKVNPNVNKAYIADKSGVICLSSVRQEVGKSIADDTAFYATRNKNEISYRNSSKDGGISIVLACPIKDSKGELLGVLLRDISIDYLTRYVKGLKIGNSGYMYILDDDGTTLSHYYSNRSDLSENRHDAGAANLLNFSRSLKNNTVTKDNGFFEYGVGGKKLLANYNIVPGTGWASVAVVSFDEINANAREFNTIMLGTAAIVVVVAVLIGLLNARRIIDSLEKIRDTVSRIAEGRLETPVNYSGKDEFAELYADVGLMAHKLNISYQKLSDSAKTDVLTGLPNRLAVYEAMDRQLDSTGRQAAIMLDLDGFKQVNDTFGHDIGDELLIIVGNILRDISTPQMTVSRLGGDEFFIFINQYESRDELGELGERLVHEITSVKEVSGRAVNISASVGISSIDGNDDKSSIMKKADIAMYRAKKSGKRRSVIYDK